MQDDYNDNAQGPIKVYSDGSYGRKTTNNGCAYAVEGPEGVVINSSSFDRCRVLDDEDQNIWAEFKAVILALEEAEKNYGAGLSVVIHTDLMAIIDLVEGKPFYRQYPAELSPVFDEFFEALNRHKVVQAVFACDRDSFKGEDHVKDIMRQLHNKAARASGARTIKKPFVAKQDTDPPPADDGGFFDDDPRGENVAHDEESSLDDGPVCGFGQ